MVGFCSRWQTGPHEEQILRQRPPLCKFLAEEFARTPLLWLSGTQRRGHEPSSKLPRWGQNSRP